MSGRLIRTSTTGGHGTTTKRTIVKCFKLCFNLLNYKYVLFGHVNKCNCGLKIRRVAFNIFTVKEEI